MAMPVVPARVPTDLLASARETYVREHNRQPATTSDVIRAALARFVQPPPTPRGGSALT